MNAYSNAFTKKERTHPVIDRNPTFSKAIKNCNRFEYLSISGSVFSYVLCFAANVRTGMKPKFRDLTYWTSLTGGMNVFIISVKNSADRLMGFLPNDDEVARLNNGELENMNTSTKQWDPVVSKAMITSSCFNVSTVAALQTLNVIGNKGGSRISNLATCGLVFGAAYASVNSSLRFLCFPPNSDDKIEKITREYPVIDGKPDFSKVVGNFNTLDCFRIPASSCYCVIGAYRFVKPALRGQYMRSGGLCGLLFGFGNSYMESSGRLKGAFPNDGSTGLSMGLNSLHELGLDDSVL